jgi:cardiolipin synthase
MARAASRGVDVRLLYDPQGSNETDPRIFEWLRARGVRVRAYRPLRVSIRSGSWWPRDHSRIVVVDGSSYTGGVAWGDEWLPREYGGHGWHDVSSRVAGPCAHDFAHVFERRWREAYGAVAIPSNYTTGSRYEDLELLADSPVDGAAIVERYRERIHSARSRVWLANAYFFAPGVLMRELCAAADRGVDVRIVLPQPTDLAIVKAAARAEIHEWGERGLKV